MRHGLVLAASTIVLVVAGCGSDSSTGGGKILPSGDLSGCDGGRVIAVSPPPGDVTTLDSARKVSKPSIDLVAASIRASEVNSLCVSIETKAAIRKGTDFLVAVLSESQSIAFNIETLSRGRTRITSSDQPASGAQGATQGRLLTSALPEFSLTPSSEFGVQIGATAGQATDRYPQGDNFIWFPDGETVSGRSIVEPG